MSPILSRYALVVHRLLTYTSNWIVNYLPMILCFEALRKFPLVLREAQHAGDDLHDDRVLREAQHAGDDLHDDDRGVNKTPESCRLKTRRHGSFTATTWLPLPPALLLVLMLQLLPLLAKAGTSSQAGKISMNAGLHLIWEGISFQVSKKKLSGASLHRGDRSR